MSDWRGEINNIFRIIKNEENDIFLENDAPKEIENIVRRAQAEAWEEGVKYAKPFITEHCLKYEANPYKD